VSITDVIVVLLGTIAAGGAMWLFRGRVPIGPTRGPGVHDVRVVVRSGFHPDVILAEPGRRVRLRFFRDEMTRASERVVFRDLSIDQPLPAFETTTVEFTPEASGDYRFECDGCARGVVAAQIGGEVARTNLGRGHAKHG
jgi:P-type Cu+ transporter